MNTVLEELFSKTYNIWMIHEVNEKDLEILKNLSPESNIFIWDDAVLSQYFIIKNLLGYKNILGVSTNIANYATEQLKNKKPILYEPTHDSHTRWHEMKDATAFMTWNHIRELMDLNVHIAAHGYNHTRIKYDIKIGFKELMEDCRNIVEDFSVHLCIEPDLYVYPYNDKTTWSDIVLKKYNMLSIGPKRLNFNKMFPQ